MKKLSIFVLGAVACFVAQAGAQSTRPFNAQRTYPSTSPSESLAAAQQQRQALERKHASSIFNSNIGPTTIVTPTPLQNWSQMGPLAIAGLPGGLSGSSAALSGRVSSIVTSAKNPQLMYLAAAGGGVWRSEDAGISWSPAGDTTLSLASGTLVFDERVGSQGTLYYGTGDFNGGTYGAGILKSTDGGVSWQQLSSQFEIPLGSQTLRIALHPTDPQTLFVARLSGIWKSTDGGASWTETLKGVATDVVTGDPSNPNLVFAALGDVYGSNANGVYRSVDGGSNWTLLTGLPAGITTGRITLAKTAADPSVVAALISSSTDFSLNGVYLSNDFGQRFHPLAITPQLFFSPNYGYNRGWFTQMLYIDPQSSANIYVGGEQLWRSTNQGATFSNLSQDSASRQLIHEGIFGIAFQAGSPLNFYVATEGGIFQTINGGQTWFNLNRGLPIAQVNAVAVAPGGGTLLAAAESSGISTLGGDQSIWTQNQPLNSGTTFFDPNPSVNNIYGGGSLLHVMRSLDGGSTWNTNANGIAATDPVAYYPPYVADPTQGNVLFGTSRVWRLTSASASWTAVSPQLATNGNYLTALAVAPSGRVYAGSSDGRIWSSANGATNWRAGTGIAGGLTITSIATDPKSPLRAYATMTGFVTGHVFRTQDGGVTWQDLTSPATGLPTTNLPNVSANSIVIDPRGPIYVATDVGVFRNEDGNSPWTSYNQGLPNTIVTSLALDLDSNLLVAGTYGRGTFGIALRAPAANGPAIQALGIVDSASGSIILAPGTIATMFGTNLAGSGNVTITLNGVSAPLLYVSSSQINFQVPFEITTSGVAVTLTTSGGSNAAFLEISPASPGIYGGQPMTHANGSAVTAASPAIAGETITLTASGLGDTTPGSVTGAPAPAQPAPLQQGVTAFVNGVSAAVTAAGEVPGQVGLYFVSLTVPANAAVTGNVPLAIVAGGRLSNTVTLAVR